MNPYTGSLTHIACVTLKTLREVRQHWKIIQTARDQNILVTDNRTAVIVHHTETPKKILLCIECENISGRAICPNVRNSFQTCPLTKSYND